MRILISSMYAPGHLSPLLPYAKRLRDIGHEVLICAPECAADKIAKAGLDHAPGPDSCLDEIIAAFAGTEHLSEEEKDVITMPRAFVDLVARKALANVRDTINHWKPDLILRETCEFAGLIAAQESNVPHVRIAILNPAMEPKFVDLCARAIDDLRQEIGLPPDNGAAIRSEPTYTAFPRSLGDTKVAPHAPEPIRVGMPRDAVAPCDTRPTWMPSHGRPLVYVTFGTQSGTNDREREMYRTALDAVADLPVQVLLTTGPNMAGHPLGAIPDNVVVKSFVSQELVFKHAKLVVTHGGSGTMLGALAAGLPVVVAPMFADQPHNARSVSATGAGVAVFDADATQLRAGIQQLLDTPDHAQSARRIASEMAGMMGLDQALSMMLGHAAA